MTRENLQRALKRVRANKGVAGVDGLDIDQTVAHLRTAWPALREQLLSGTYRPSPVRRVTIPKPDGGERELGIPTVTDRLIQQALLQVLQPILDPTFSEHSYGFRPSRGAHDAVLAAQSYVQSGRRIVVDVDLEKFFDRVDHDILIDRLQKRIGDTGVIRLIRAYLNSGIMDDGVVQKRAMGTPQGGPLSPLLANVLLDEVDKALERRGHCFVRYADDANVYVRSRRAGERVMALLRRLYGELHLTVSQRDQKRSGQRVRSQVPGLRLLAGSGRSDQTQGRRKAAEDVQAARPATDLPKWRAQYARCGGAPAALCSGMEGLLPAGANAEGLARAGSMAAASIASHPAQTVEARHDHAQGVAGNGSQA
ncbi:MAG TPA: group II intron reverse transcriptase/maturase [Mycobacterium sp.]|nr:group II intron reverse transcriptase/maturase [Mycobacterium sp.]